MKQEWDVDFLIIKSYNIQYNLRFQIKGREERV